MAEVAPYGSWASPITTAALTEAAVSLATPLVDGTTVYWVEGRPEEGGRQVVVRLDPGGKPRDVLPDGFAARTLVHEYGGLCVAVRDGVMVFANLEDQRLYSVAEGGSPVPITPPPPTSRADRYAAPVIHPTGRWLYCVRERHRADGVTNDLVHVPLDGSAAPHVVAEGHDFFSHPTLAPDGSRLSWTCWDHPRMPWDGTELIEAVLGADGRPDPGAGVPRTVAGGAEESVTEPRYAPDGRLFFISDRSDWWNLYVDDGAGGRPVGPLPAEVGGPDWVFGNASYAVLADGTVVARWTSEGLAHLGTVAPSEVDDGAFEPVALEATAISDLRPLGRGVLAIVGSGSVPPALVHVELPGPPAGGGHRTPEVTVLRTSRAVAVDPSYLSLPEPITFPTDAPGDPEAVAHALYYPPANPDFEGPSGTRPPLIVQSHGGPTSAAVPVLNLRTQYWTSRGFGVVDVDYGGSTGYGRAYRRRLEGAWGVVDVEDCVRAALYLAGEGRVDPERLLIHGGSAGGYTTLCAVTFRDVFAAGASYYGVADLAALARDTHKFEARYLDSLVGPWPEAEAVYRERSPICHVERLVTPLILFQGLEDAVVPPAQTEEMAAALERNGVAHATITYPGEQHGFRDAATIRRTAEAELAFYGAVLGFEPADPIEPVPIRHLDRAGPGAG